MKILKRSSSTENPVDTRYKGLDVDLDPIDSAHADFKVKEPDHFLADETAVSRNNVTSGSVTMWCSLHEFMTSFCCEEQLSQADWTVILVQKTRLLVADDRRLRA